MTARDYGISADRGSARNRRNTARQDIGKGLRWRPPWRVEGERPDTESDRWADSWRHPGGSRFWLVLTGLLVLNRLFSGLLLAPPQRLDVPYTFFREQVEAGNVVEVTAIGDTIEGRFEQAVAHPPPTRERRARKARANRSPKSRNRRWPCPSRSGTAAAGALVGPAPSSWRGRCCGPRHRSWALTTPDGRAGY